MVTPQIEAPEIAKKLGIPKLFLKREDMHPYGSHKGRSIPLMIDAKLPEGSRHFGISSSGNAALAAIRHIQKKNAEEHANDPVRLSVFVGENIHPDKKRAIMDEVKDPNVSIEETPRPLQAFIKLLSGGRIESLRQSTEDIALAGYKELAREISHTENLTAVFVAASTGTAAQGIAEYFANPSDEKARSVKVHLVQTTGVSPIAQAINQEETESALSIADAIVDKVAHRRESASEAVRKTGGNGWVATNDDIREAQRLLKENAGIDATPNGALGLAGLIRGLKRGLTFDGAVVCIITGK